jgi:putative heme transporter
MERADPDRTPLRARTIWVVFGNTLLFATVLAVLWAVREVVGWTLVALLLSLAMYPGVDALRARRVPRGLAILIVCLVAIGSIATIVGAVVPLLVEQLTALVERAPDLLSRLKEAPPFRWAEQTFGLTAQLDDVAREELGAVAAPAIAVAGSVLQGVVAFISVIVLTVFMLVFGEDLFRNALAWVRPGARDEVMSLAIRMRRVVGAYVAGTLLVAMVGGVVMGVAMVALGVPYFLPLGLVMFVLGLIPFLGSAIGAVLVVGVTLATQGVKAGIIVAIVYLVYQQIENNLLQPLVQKRTIQMNPLLIALVLLGGTSLGGVLGALLALPAAGAIQVFLSDTLARRNERWRLERHAPGARPLR